MKVSYEIYVLPGDEPDMVAAAEEHDSGKFAEFVHTVYYSLGKMISHQDDPSTRQVNVSVNIGGTLRTFEGMWFDTAMMETLQFGLTFKHQQLAGKQGREGTTDTDEMRDHGII